MVRGTPEETKARVRAYYAETPDLIAKNKNWGGSAYAFHLGLDDGTCTTRP